MTEAECDGLCITAAEVGIPMDGVAYAHPACPRHAEADAVCPCDTPNRCLSPSHGQISLNEALAVKNRQKRVR